MTKHIEPWWGEFSLATGEAASWSIGPARLWIEHHAREWQLAYCVSPDVADTTSRVDLHLPLGQAGADATVTRYGLADGSAQLNVMPILADRPIVSRPEIPLFVLPQQTLTLYVSSPLWLQVRAGAQQQLLQDIPILRPSDTWSGPLTRSGGLCYASSTMARTDLENFPFSPLRAITPIHLSSRAEQSVLVERLSLPVPYLSLYQAADGTLWTEAVELECRSASELALVQLNTEAPPEAGAAVRLSAARSKADRGLLSKAFGSLFGLGGSDDGVD